MLDDRPYVRESKEKVLHIWGDEGYFGKRCKSVATKSNTQSIYYLKVLNFLETEKDEAVLDRQFGVLCKICLKELLK